MVEKQIELHQNPQMTIVRFVVPLAFSIFMSFFALGFLQNFYRQLWQFWVITILLNIFITTTFDFILNHITSIWKNTPEKYLVAFIVLLPSLAVVGLTIQILVQYQDPLIFSSEFFLPDRDWLVPFLSIASLSSGLTMFAISKTKQQTWQTSKFANRIQRNLPGLLLASAITISTFIMASAFNHPGMTPVDNFFDTDSGEWINRLTARVEDLIPLRSVHPFAFLILRPPSWLLALILNGDKFYAATLLNSLFGGICVYLTWLFFKLRTNNTTYSLLMATLIGLSTSHLLLSVFLETYIFSAALLIAFMVLLQYGERAPIRLLPIGLLTFGITITNFVQTCIAYFSIQPNIKNLLKYIALALGIAVILAFTQSVIYPSSEPFYIPSKLAGEQVYGFNIFESETQLIVSRANVLLRNIFLMSIVAPRPLILLKEAGCSFPCFQTMFKVQGTHYIYASYIGFGSLLARIWFTSVVLAGIFYIRNFIKSPQQAAMQTALLANIVFNFVLHMNYGDDPILYSPDWTYALVFFFGISYEGLADRKWFQATLLVFLAGLLINNLDLFHKMLDAIAPFMGQ